MDHLQDISPIANKYYKDNDFKSIEKLLTDKVLEANKNPDLYAFRAAGFYENQDFENAYKYAQLAIELSDQNKYGFLERGKAFLGKGDGVNAINDFGQAINLDKNFAEAFYFLGLANFLIGNFRGAIEDFNQAVAINDNYYQAYCDRGLVYFTVGEHDKAREDFDKSIQTNDKYAIAYYNKGLLAQQLLKYDDAIKDYTNAIKNDKKLAIAYNNRGNIYLNREKYDVAVKDFDKAIKLNPKLAVAYLNRGIIFNQQLKYDDAHRDFEKAKTLFATDARINEQYLNLLEEKMELIKEKKSDKQRDLSTSGEVDLANVKLNLEENIDLHIDRIRKAAKSDVKNVVHYTKLLVADIYVKSTNVKMHYSNSIYMNDPTEGRVLFEYLDDDGIKMAYDNGERFSESSIYLGSFLPTEDDPENVGHEDELVMWRTYGKDENGKEAAGCSVLIDSTFFKAQNSADAVVADDPSNVLLNVIYVKNQQKQKVLQIAEDSGIQKALIDIKAELNLLINMKSGKSVTDSFRAEIDKSVFKRLSGITYLFKSADYEYEHEVRIIKYMARNSDAIKSMAQTETDKPSKRFYIESLNYVLPYIKKIFLGPKVENHQQWSLYFDFEIRQRDKDVRGMTPPPYTLNPSIVKMLKSENKFQ